MMNPRAQPAWLEAAITDHLRSNLKAHLMAEAEKVVDQTVSELEGDLKVSVTQYRNTQMMTDFVEVLVKDRRGAK